MAQESRDYHQIVAEVSDAVEQAVKERMGRHGDYRPLYVYVSVVDGGWTIGHEGQHEGMWRTAEPVATPSTGYQFIQRVVAAALRRAPLFAEPHMNLTLADCEP